MTDDTIDMRRPLATMTSDSLFIRALRRQPTPRRPVWFMRQAGRYLPEYQETRARAGGFLNLVRTPELACEVALQPVRRFGLDAGIVFSDILVIPDAMGLELEFAEGSGPVFNKPVRDEQAVAKLREPEGDALDYVSRACQVTRGELPAGVPLIGFCGSPFTLACYMVDGCGSDFWHARHMMHARPDLFRRIVEVNARAVSNSLVAQARAGCEAVMIFDSWGGLLDRRSYELFSLAPIRRIVAAVQRFTKTPVIVFARGCGPFLSDIASSRCDCVGVDWHTTLSEARRRTRGRVSLQGNLDPAALAGDMATAKKAARAVLKEHGSGPGHIFNLGHGVDRRTPPENVEAVVETAHNFPLSGVRETAEAPEAPEAPEAAPPEAPEAAEEAREE